MVDEPTQYTVYVVRYWEEQDAQLDRRTYRFTLEIPGTGQRFGFINLDALMSALKHRLFQDSTQKNS